MKLGKKIRQFRKKSGMTQKDLADMLGIASAHLGRLELGHYKPSIEIVKKLADIFQVTTDYLLDDKTDDFKEVSIEDGSFAERMRLLNALSEKDRQAVIQIVDSLLTKTKIQLLLEKEETGKKK